MLRNFWGLLLLLVCMTLVQAKPQVEDSEEESGDLKETLLQLGFDDADADAVRKAVESGTELDSALEQKIQEKFTPETPEEKEGEPGLVGITFQCAYCKRLKLKLKMCIPC